MRAGRIACRIESGRELGSVNSNLERHARQDHMIRITRGNRCQGVAARATQGQHYFNLTMRAGRSACGFTSLVILNLVGQAENKDCLELAVRR